uniref:Uncharacterized protein n=1 Tax=Romanomermis culicivorax TaxID=13658 RepID=A0A915JAY2_ROMCU
MNGCHFIATIVYLRQIKLEDTMDQFENNISTLSATERNPKYFRQLMPSKSMFFQKYYKTHHLEIEAKIDIN